MPSRPGQSLRASAQRGHVELAVGGVRDDAVGRAAVADARG